LLSWALLDRGLNGTNCANAFLFVVRGRIFLKGKNGFEILLERLCALKDSGAPLVEHAPMSDDDKFKIFALMMTHDDARLEEVPGLGLKVTLPACARHRGRAQMMKASQREQPVDVATEPISHSLKVCILTELYAHPGSQVVKRNGQLFFQNGRFEFLCERLCEAKHYSRPG